MNSNRQIVIIGGGAAGFFCGVNIGALMPGAEIHMIEKSRQLLSKVKISGGGRCNVTHACFDPGELIQFYPRGGKELLGPFHKFQPADTIQWFEDHGVELHAEDDGRMFPITNDSQTIIDCFLREAKKYHLHIHTGLQVDDFHLENNHWVITCADGKTFHPQAVFIATGSSMQMWKSLQALGHQIEKPVPSLFTCNIRDKRIDGLMGVSIPNAQVHIAGTDIYTNGPLLITHWGLSGPAILKLSAWGARYLADKQYRTAIIVNFIPEHDTTSCIKYLREFRQQHPKKQVTQNNLGNIPMRLWKQLCAYAAIHEQMNWADMSNQQLDTLAQTLTASSFAMNGKSTFKEEFVTCGGIKLSEVNMRTMESKILPGLYFGGEMLDIDAVTGGFNFQAAWTTGWLAAQAIAVRLKAD